MKFQTFINENKHIVVVKAENPMKEYYKEFCDFYKKYHMYSDEFVFAEFIYAYGDQINKMVGIATCNVEAGDVFDKEFGEALARKRYLKVFETYRIRMYEMMQSKIEKMANSLDKRWGVCYRRRARCADEIEKMASRID